MPTYRIHNPSHAFLVGEIVREERIKSKLTQQQLADLTGLKKSFVCKLESGTSNPQLNTIIKIFELGFKKSLTIVVD